MGRFVPSKIRMWHYNICPFFDDAFLHMCDIIRTRIISFSAAVFFSEWRKEAEEELSECSCRNRWSILK